MLPRMLILLAALAAASPLDGHDQIYPQLAAQYVDLHRNPELSTKEQRTSARMADELRKCRGRRILRLYFQASNASPSKRRCAPRWQVRSA
jgi:hypothetical protein